MSAQKSRRRIAMVSEHASPLALLGGVDAGGQNVAVAELSAALAAQGHEVVVYTRRDDTDLLDRVDTEHGYTVVHVPAGPPRKLPKDDLLQYMPAFGDFLAEQWEQWRPDVAHAHFWMSGLATLRAARRRGVPVVQTFHALGVVKRRHQGRDDTSPDERIRLETELARKVDWVAATCTDEVAELRRMGRDQSAMSVVPCGVNPTEFCHIGPAATRGKPQRIVSVGRLVPRKGFETVIRAMPQLPTAELVIVGGPDKSELDSDAEAQRLNAVAGQCGVADRVHLYGAIARDEMPMLLRSADVVAATPWYEPFGIVPLEAMACGVPVVASAVGGMLDTVVDEGTGRLVPPRDPRRCADAITPILADRNLRAALGRAGRARVQQRYSWQRVAEETAAVYDRMAGSVS
ncbi:glycosyl transferase [Mycolicibacterium chubuense]|uniref:D-inositol 3-phosphate glycosyltransferase n=1 Tax=Mycolicibacterium chubuense TaxID=1800 RepID=A0A0J6V9G5_MYCCU|nr:glycosyltransferase [Mycolicibacterium chubuense]KMO66854.1 D-inositol 3-phosphate glycosyltransferase [Mycolicibacterium chubuense]ORA43776.1 glycosyl transferase [Mycolicibacterium chubuense]SPX95952.1 transferase [Mycolicibacterium chubuense]